RPGEPAYGWLRPLPWDAGVDVFFVISGFVMVWSSMRLFGRRDAARLFLGRQARVAVPWVVATIVVLAGIGRVLRPASPALAFWTDSIVLEFAFGVLLATLALSGARLTPAPRLLLVFAALALLVVSDRLPELPRGLAYGVPCTLLMAAAVLAPVRPIRSRWTEFWVLLGDASYAL